jgi:hypothetical protein
MHVKKTDKGFELVDEPMRVEGDAAKQFAKDLETKPTEESRRFQAQAREVYDRVQGKISV